MDKKIFILLIALFFSNNSFSEILSVDRRINWKPGLDEDFPVKLDTVYLSDYGPIGNGIEDDYPAFNSAIEALSEEGGMLWIAAGSYRIKNTLHLKRSIVLHGEGIKNTHLFFEFTEEEKNCIEIIRYDRGPWVQLVSGFTKSSEAVVVENTDGFEIGDFVEIKEENNPTIMSNYPTWNEWWAQNAVGQILKISKIDGDTLKLDRPLYIQYEDSRNPLIRRQNFLLYAGIENLHINRLDSHSGYNIAIKNAAYCRIDNIESEMGSWAHIHMATCSRSEIKNSYFHHAHQYLGEYGFGLIFSLHCSDNLIENNIIYHLRRGLMIFLGASGNVFGYNYSIEPYVDASWIPDDVSMDGLYPNFNLFESNVIQQLGVGNVGGPVGPGNTFVRNQIASGDMTISNESHSQNIIGNVFSGTNNTIQIEDSVDYTLIHGNTINDIVLWAPDISDYNIPSSYYLLSIPDFFNNQPWPLFGPFQNYPNKLPAQERFEGYQTAVQEQANNSNDIMELGFDVYPNPFNPETRISYYLQSHSHVLIQMYDIRGRLISTLLNEFQEKGKYKKQISYYLSYHDQLSSGIYFIRLNINGTSESKKITVLR